MSVVPAKALVVYSDDEDDTSITSPILNPNPPSSSSSSSISSQASLSTHASAPSEIVADHDSLVTMEMTSPKDVDMKSPSSNDSFEVSELEATIHRLFELRKQGYRFNETMIQSYEFLNPGLYKKMIEFFNLDEFGSNYSLDQFNPYHIEVFADELTAQQNKRYQKSLKK